MLKEPINLGLCLSLSLSLSMLIAGSQPAHSAKKNKKSAVQATEPAAGKENPKLNTAQEREAVTKIGNLQDLSRWLTYYYLHPTPELTVQAIKVADKENLFQGSTQPVIVAFLSLVFRQNPSLVPQWMEQLNGIHADSRNAILNVLWWANTSETKLALENQIKTLSPEAQKSLAEQIRKTPEEIDSMPIGSADVLDMLWACFSESGDPKYVKRILSTLAWADEEKRDFNRLSIAAAARWSLSSNADQHEKVLQICLEAAQSDDKLKKYLAEITEKSSTNKSQYKI